MLDFGYVDPSNIYLSPIPIEIYQERMKERKRCINDVDLFTTERYGIDSCPELCYNHLGLFKREIMIFDRLIYAENEIYNMFFQPLSEHEDISQRLKNKINHFHEIRQTYIDKGFLVLKEKEGLEVLSILKEKEDSKFKFGRVRIFMSDFLGINSYNTPMDPFFYKSFEMIKAIGIFFTLIKLFID
jgi:hypothetical protein